MKIKGESVKNKICTKTPIIFIIRVYEIFLSQMDLLTSTRIFIIISYIFETRRMQNIVAFLWLATELLYHSLCDQYLILKSTTFVVLQMCHYPVIINYEFQTSISFQLLVFDQLEIEEHCFIIGFWSIGNWRTLLNLS